MKLTANFNYNRLDHSQSNTAHLVVSLEAPTIDWLKQRPRICILPIIDASGSMHGAKLEYAKASVRKLIQQLAPGDVAGLGVLESRYHTIVAPKEVTAEFKSELLKAVDNIHIMGGTNFSDALTESLGQIKKLDLPLQYLLRVILFTDGQPTEGITDQGALKTLLTSNMGRATVSFFGYGGETRSTWTGCDHDFLTEMSDLGKGNYAYVQNPDDSLAAFGKELGGLLSTYASDIKVALTPVGSHRITKVVSDVKFEEEIDGEYILDFGDILAEEKRHLVFEVEFQAQNKAFPRDTKVFEVSASYMRVTPDGKEVQSLRESAKVRFVRKSDAQETPHKDIDTIVGMHQMVRAQLEAQEKADQGLFDAAQNIMVSLSHNFTDRGLEQIAAAAGYTGDLMNAVNYVDSSNYLRSMRRGATRGMGTSSLSADATQVLASTGAVLNNSSQVAYSNSFRGSK